MRISHKKKKEEPKKQYFFNAGITAPEVLLLGTEGENRGVVNTAEAIRMAKEEGLDLVEINPKTTPPVARIMDFGQFRYAQEKEARLRKAHQHVVDTKCVRLSLRIGRNDLEIRLNQSLEFLEEGNKVKIEIVLRGREMQQGKLAFDMLKSFIAEINQKVSTRFDQIEERQGNKVTATIVKS